MSKQCFGHRLNRRGFAKVLAATPAAAPLLFAQQQPAQTAPAGPPNPNTTIQQQQQRGRTAPPEVKPFDSPIEFSRSFVAPKARAFPMTQVRLLPGSTFHDAQEWNRGYMARLDADRLIHNFKLTAGLPSSAAPLGGWETYVDPSQPRRGQEGELRGHFTGHFLSASALLYASTGDKAAKDKADYMVAELAKCQQKLNQDGYLSAFPHTWFDRLDARTPVWAPFYTIHKIMAGMFDMYSLAGNKQALQVLEGMANWADHWTASKTEEHMQEILMTEYGGMAEVLYNLAAATDNDRWAKAGDRYTKKWFFNPLAMHRDELNRGPNGFPLHANTHIPQVIGAARRYELSGDMRFHDVADFFFYTVSTGRTYVTGGTSNGESWNGEPRGLSAEWKRNVSTAECCCSYNMLKLARHLYTWDPDPRYFDYYERALMNERIGTIRPEKGYTQYYLSLTPGAWKTFNTEDQSFWCCTGTGVEEYSKLNDSIYWHDDKGVYVNLFIPSELNWEEKGFKLKQENRFPEQQSTRLTVTVSKPTQMAVRLRIPEWANGGAVKINGKALEATAAPSSYLTINRLWKSGDHVEMDLPMQLSVETMPDDPKIQAYLYGPMVLAGDLGNEGLTEQMIIGPNAPRMRNPAAPPRANAQNPNGPPRFPTAPPIEVPAFKASAADPSTWIKPGDKPLTFHTTGQEKNVTLVPINTLFDKRYSVYWRVS